MALSRNQTMSLRPLTFAPRLPPPTVEPRSRCIATHHSQHSQVETPTLPVHCQECLDGPAYTSMAPIVQRAINCSVKLSAARQMVLEDSPRVTDRTVPTFKQTGLARSGIATQTLRRALVGA